MKPTSSHINSCLYPHSLLMNIKAHTREHLYSRTYARTHNKYTRNALNSKCLNFGFLYEWGIIIPSPLRTRLIVGIGGYLADFEVVIVVKTIFSLCAFCLQACDYQRVVRIARARSLLSRIVCVVCL